MTTIANDLRNIATTIMTNKVDGQNLRPLNPIGFFSGRSLTVFIVVLALLPTLMPISISAQNNSADLAEMLQRTARTVSPAIMAIGHDLMYYVYQLGCIRKIRDHRLPCKKTLRRCSHSTQYDCEIMSP